MRGLVLRGQFWAKVRGKRALFGVGKFLIAALHGFPKAVPVHAGKEMPMHRIPLRSTKADAKRAMHERMKRMVGDQNLTWKRARQIANALEREQRAEERERARIAALKEQFSPTDHVAVISSGPEKKQPWWRRMFRRAA